MKLLLEDGSKAAIIAKYEGVTPVIIHLYEKLPQIVKLPQFYEVKEETSAAGASARPKTLSDVSADMP